MAAAEFRVSGGRTAEERGGGERDGETGGKGAGGDGQIGTVRRRVDAGEPSSMDHLPFL